MKIEYLQADDYLLPNKQYNIKHTTEERVVILLKTSTRL